MKPLLLALFATFALWAADLTGKWDFTVETTGGSGTPKFDLVQKGETLTGKYSGQLGEADVKGTLKNDTIEIRFQVEAGAIVYAGKVLPDGTMKGTVDLVGQASGTWTAKRAK